MQFWLEHLHSDDRQIVADLRQKLHSGQVDRISAEYRYLHPTRGQRWLHHSACLSESSAGGAGVRTFGVIRDITERKETEEGLQRLRLQLWHADRVAQTGAITASLAHELNQPLTGILSTARQVERRLDAELDAVVLADKAQLQQVLLNLAMNALEAMDGQPTGQRNLDLSLTRPRPGEALVSLRDPGHGIPEDHREKLFAASWTTKPQGMGIGLQISYAIIESHGGRLWCANNPDGGSHFPLHTPTCCDHPDHRLGKPMSQNDPMIFIVDDDPSAGNGLLLLVRSAGWQCEAFASAREFLARPAISGTGCVILDVCMPGMTGLELCDLMAAHPPSLPIIFLTGHGDLPMGVDAMKKGAVDFLQKPVDAEALLKAIHDALERHAKAQSHHEECERIQAHLRRLTPREREVLEYVIGGHLNKQIAAAMQIAEQTVKIHRKAVMQKMDVSSAAELVRQSERVGIAPRSLTAD